MEAITQTKDKKIKFCCPENDILSKREQGFIRLEISQQRRSALHAKRP